MSSRGRPSSCSTDVRAVSTSEINDDVVLEAHWNEVTSDREWYNKGERERGCMITFTSARLYLLHARENLFIFVLFFFVEEEIVLRVHIKNSQSPPESVGSSLKIIAQLRSRIIPYSLIIRRNVRRE